MNVLPWGSTLTLMALSLLVCVWIFGYVGIGVHALRTHVYAGFADMMLPDILLMVPASLALASGKISGILIALPYIALLALNFFVASIVSGRNFPEMQVVHAWRSFHIAWVVPTAIIALLRNRSQRTTERLYKVAFALQLVVLAGAMYHFTYRYGVLHLAEPVVAVSRLRLGNGSLNFPLIEEEAAYIVSGRDGRLYRIDLAQSRKVFVAQMPRPQPAEMGFPQMTLPDIVRRHPTPYFGFLQRIDEDEINFRFVHSLTGRIILDGGRAWGKKDWTIRVRINEESGQVVWHLLGTTADVPITFFPGEPLGPVQTVSPGGRVIAGTLDYPHRPFTVLIEGEGVKTAIDPLGQVEWITADQGWILIGTNRGGLIIVSVKNN